MTKTQSSGWGSRVGLILAMAGNAVGLGNFLRFPAQAIENGGGAFIIPYLVCFLLMGLPLLFVEWSMGRYGGKHGQHSTPFIFDAMGKAPYWKYFGVFGIFTNIAVAAFYCYLESWALSWAYYSVTGAFTGMSQEEVGAFFKNYIELGTNHPVVFWMICLFLNTWILSRGLSGGVEKVAKIGMPLLLAFGAVLAVTGITLQAEPGGAVNDGLVGLNYLWTPDFDSIWSFKVWVAAAGQIFFTLSLGMGSIHCYASYLNSKEDVALNAMSAGWMNEFVEVVLGSAVIIPISIGYLGIEAVTEMVSGGSGLGIGFAVLPKLFSGWGVFGIFAGVMWFGLLFFAGITSSLAMGTPVMGFLKDNFKIKESTGAWIFGSIILLLGIPCVLSPDAFNEYDYWAGTIALVIFAMIEIVLFAWVFGMDKGWREINTGADIKVPTIFKFIIQYVSPLFLIVVFIGAAPGIWENATKETSFYGWLARFLLIGLFVGVAMMVYIAKKRNNPQYAADEPFEKPNTLN
ncbi:MAG: sodium:calcium symporter [Flavobacteriales bacterium]|nr:sodium:calcium symporter [Flavobacteriales bacterium]